MKTFLGDGVMAHLARLVAMTAALSGVVIAGLTGSPALAHQKLVPERSPTPKLHATGRFLQDPNGKTQAAWAWYPGCQR